MAPSDVRDLSAPGIKSTLGYIAKNLSLSDPSSK